MFRQLAWIPNPVRVQVLDWGLSVYLWVLSVSLYNTKKLALWFSYLNLMQSTVDFINISCAIFNNKFVNRIEMTHEFNQTSVTITNGSLCAHRALAWNDFGASLDLDCVLIGVTSPLIKTRASNSYTSTFWNQFCCWKCEDCWKTEIQMKENNWKENKRNIGDH